MIPRKIGRLPDQRGFITVRGYPIMALNKTAGETKKDGATAKKAAAKGSTAKKAAPKKAVAAAPAAPKKAAPKKAAGPKLTPPQTELLKKVAGITDPLGYVAAKKPENKVLEALLKHKVIKKGKKNETGGYYYLISNAGTKHLKALDTATPKSS
jgi:glucan-binding YG repeat protein